MALRASDLRIGDSHEEVVVHNLSRTQIVQYAGASGDYNPVHTDEVFATKVTMGLSGKMLTNWVGDGRLTKYGVRFVSQVWPGDTLTSRATIQEIREENGERLVDLEITTENQDGRAVVQGSATARIDA